MKKLSKFLSLPSGEKRLLMKTFMLTSLIRLGLWLLPFNFILSRTNFFRNAKIKSNKTSKHLQDRIIWAIETVSHYVPKSTCLVKSFTTQILLSEHGYNPELHIGVAKGNEKKVEAHAWVESEGQIIMGESEQNYYTPILVLDKGKA